MAFYLLQTLREFPTFDKQYSSRHLEDNESGWDVSPTLGTLPETNTRLRHRVADYLEKASEFIYMEMIGNGVK